MCLFKSDSRLSVAPQQFTTSVASNTSQRFRSATKETMCNSIKNTNNDNNKNTDLEETSRRRAADCDRLIDSWHRRQERRFPSSEAAADVARIAAHWAAGSGRPAPARKQRMCWKI